MVGIIGNQMVACQEADKSGKEIAKLVITGHSRSKNGVASLAYVPVIPLRKALRS
jgi:hypothetical protein